MVRREAEAKSNFIGPKVPRFLKFNPVNTLAALGATAVLLGCAPSTIDSNKATKIDVTLSGNQPAFPLHATLRTNSKYCNNPENQDTAGIVFASAPDQSLALGGGVKVECKPNPMIIPEVIFTFTRSIGPGPARLTASHSEKMDLAVTPGDTLDVTVEPIEPAEWQVVISNIATGRTAKSGKYRIPASSLTTAFVEGS